MLDRRFYSLRSKKPCRCRHGIGAHHKKIKSGVVTHTCWFPGCKCRDYRPTKK